MKNIIVITGASSGFGSLTSHALSRAGHTVFAGMRETTGRNAPQVEEANRFSKEYGVDLRTIEMDVSNQPSVDAAIKAIIEQQGRIDVLIHNAGHMVFGPAEAFTPEQLAGSHHIGVFAAGWDNSLESRSYTLNVTASSCAAPSSPGVHVCSPANGSTVHSRSASKRQVQSPERSPEWKYGSMG